ncbi:RNA recognition motif domain containing protein [Entamoeba histolytica HM-1:IMSS-B]|uniref:RNA recognition motif domain containing protein n=6 Tax=Entamoeba histolytica TaxID=5759 RepID=C4MBF2_ENTH1|nr:RNA recognition motif domain containing protein [Entamoeba histolytica HM-1:IMSS]EMD42877.1 RNA recognition domain containing protein [Entamoeba histolytica KU27]EMH76095.1 RNA recognition motif domain containing protein [Entamoeba histolytica HM-1:IMSS-B]EMS15763.1 RNA recognition motif domain containing protein [Entamoeba histolytica HM-3:IMSS]ENY62313.1 RNA recognition motif domain containing protein [Entamoeba histolytica HM-1:IMSS-A]GAT99308.1 RNA recognition motif domain containing pr|eukprot:XP_654300.1 RNA recognition motif domain containing protein [Entamoeba histolytica HM-1:IMSS]
MNTDEQHKTEGVDSEEVSVDHSEKTQKKEDQTNEKAPKISTYQSKYVPSKEQQDRDRRSLCITHLDVRTTKEDLIKLFSTVGKVISITIPVNHSGISKKYAYLEMDSIENKNKAIMSFNGTRIGKNEVMVVTKRMNVAGFNKRVPKNAQNQKQSCITEDPTEDRGIKELQKLIESESIKELEKSKETEDPTEDKGIKELQKLIESEEIKKPKESEGIKELKKSKESKGIKKATNKTKKEKKRTTKINIVNNHNDTSEESSESMDNLVQNIVLGLRRNKSTEKDN